MAALVLPSHALNNTKTLTLSRPFRAISAPQNLTLSPSFPALSLSVGSSSCLSSSSLLKPIRSRSHLVYCTHGPPPQELKLELSTVEEWMDEALSLLHHEMWGKIFQDYEIADDLLCEAKWAEICADGEWAEITEDEEETPWWIISKRHDEIETAVRAIEKLADWSRRKLKELSEKRTTSKLQKLKQGKYQILTAVTELMEQDMVKTDERIGKVPKEVVREDVEEEVEDDTEEDVEELEAPGKLEDETTEVVTERKLKKWMNKAVAWLKDETEQQIEKDYEIAEDLLSEARDAESYAVSRLDQYDRLRHVNIAENTIKKLADWSARKLKELSELPKKSKLQEFRESKVAILKELCEMIKPHELKKQKTTFIQKVDEMEATKDVLYNLKDQEMVGTKKTVEELGEAYEVAKKLSDEAEEALIMANMEASFFRNLSEKQKKAIKKLAADWSDPHQ